MEQNYDTIHIDQHHNMAFFCTLSVLMASSSNAKFYRVQLMDSDFISERKKKASLWISNVILTKFGKFIFMFIVVVQLDLQIKQTVFYINLIDLIYWKNSRKSNDSKTKLYGQ
jgi:hypothetical protein